MLKDNIKLFRKQNGLSQEELAIKLNVVRQTISKWETGLSVPDCEMLIAISNVLNTPVNVLLGESSEEKIDDLKTICEKLEAINLKLAEKQHNKKRFIQISLVIICIMTIVIFIAIMLLGSPYQFWDNIDTEKAVLKVIYTAFEWLFIRIAPIILVTSIVLIVAIKRKNND